MTSLTEIIESLLGSAVQIAARKRTRIVPAPPLAASSAGDIGIDIGETVVDDMTTPVTINAKSLERLAWLVGGSGCGKTTLLLIIYVYLVMHASTLLVDFRTDLLHRALLALSKIGDESAERTHVFDLSNPERLPPFNPLSSQCGVADPYSRSANFLAAMQAADPSGGWGTTIVECGRNALTLLAFTDGSIVGAFDVLTRPASRVAAMDACPDEFVLAWFRGFHDATESRQREMASPFLNRCSHYLTRPEIRSWLGSGSSASLAGMLDGGGRSNILLGLSADSISPPVARLIGSVFIGAVSDIILARSRVPEADRSPARILIDEAQNVCTLPQIPTLLSEGRRYKCACVLANQFIGQFPTEVRQAVVANAATTAVFQMDATQATIVAPNATTDLSTTEVRSMLVSLPVGECLLVRRGEESVRVRARDYKDPDISPAGLEAFRRASFAKYAERETAGPPPAKADSKAAEQPQEEVQHVQRPAVP